jgi:exonuclease III
MAEGAAVAKRSYLFSALSPSVHFIANVETKLCSKPLSSVRKHASRAGFRSFVNPAIETCKGGVSAGERILVQKNLTISNHTCLAVGPHWRGVFLRCAKRDVLVVTVYLEHGQDPLSEENSKRLASLAAFLRTIKTQCVAIGDWNASPAQLRSAVFLEAVQGVIVVPRNVEYTCRERGSLPS